MARLIRAGNVGVQRRAGPDIGAIQDKAAASQQLANTISETAQIASANITAHQVRKASTNTSVGVRDFNAEHGEKEEYTREEVDALDMPDEIKTELLASGDEKIASWKVYPAALESHIDKLQQENSKGISSMVHRNEWESRARDSKSSIMSEANLKAERQFKIEEAKEVVADAANLLDSKDYEGASAIVEMHPIPSERKRLRELIKDRKEHDGFEEVIEYGTPDQMREEADRVTSDKYSGSLSPEQRRGMSKTLKQEAKIRQAEIDAEIAYEKSSQKSDFDIMVSRGMVGYSDIDTKFATEDGKFGFTGEWRTNAYRTLDNLYNKRGEAKATENYVYASLAGTPTLFDSDDKSHKKVADEVYTFEMGKIPTEEGRREFTVEFASRVGYLPKPVKVQFGNIHNDGLSDDHVIGVSAIYGEIARKAPKALAQASDQNNVFMESVNRHVNANGTISPDSLNGLRKMFNDQRTDVRERRAADARNILATSDKDGTRMSLAFVQDKIKDQNTNWFTAMFTGDPSVTTAQVLDFEASVVEMYSMASDDAEVQLEDVMNAAWTKNQNIYQVTEVNGIAQTMRNAPEYAYGISSEDARKDLHEQAAGMGIPAGKYDVEIVSDYASTTSTKPSYPMYVRTEDGLLEEVTYSDGVTPFRYTPNVEAIKEASKRQKEFEAHIAQNRAEFERASVDRGKAFDRYDPRVDPKWKEKRDQVKSKNLKEDEKINAWVDRIEANDKARKQDLLKNLGTKK